MEVGLEWAYPSDGGRRSFLPDDLPNCLCEPVVPMFEGGLREVTTDNIETTLCFDGLKYGGLLEMAALMLMFNCPKRGCTREPRLGGRQRLKFTRARSCLQITQARR